METATMGRVIVTAKIENLDDLMGVHAGRNTADKVRSVEVSDALVDTGATFLGMPKSLILQLGLQPFRTRPMRSGGGPITVTIYQAARVTVQGRDCNCDVMELPDDCPVVLGQIPLEQLDFVIDPMGQRLIGNPAHGGQHMIECF
jgi:predicted aspartyl protease